MGALAHPNKAGAAMYMVRGVTPILIDRGVFDGASGAASAALFVGAQTPSGHKNVTK